MKTPPPAPPETEFALLSDLFAGHDDFRPETTDELVGVELRLHVANGPTIDVIVEDASHLRWRADTELPWGAEGVEEYEAVVIRDSIYAVTIARLDENASALVFLDRVTGRLLANLTTFEEVDGSAREHTHFVQAGIDGPLEQPYERTDELVGMRIAQRYSDTHLFEHIYLNPNTYAFQGLAGPEAGVAAVDPADYWKLGEDLYLFSWHERHRPFNGAVVNDLAHWRATGRLVGWDDQDKVTLQVRTRSMSTLLSVTSYEDL